MTRRDRLSPGIQTLSANLLNNVPSDSRFCRQWPKIEDEDELGTITIEERKRLSEVRGKENLVLVGPFILARNRSPIVLELELVLGICQIGAVDQRSNNPGNPTFSPMASSQV
jgi:hypothetical protein